MSVKYPGQRRSTGSAGSDSKMDKFYKGEDIIHFSIKLLIYILVINFSHLKNPLDQTPK
jgi:hypothetical protein